MRLALLTPTYGAHLEHFRLLRESLLAAGCTWPHLAVVQTEDLPAFRRAGLDAQVQLVASAEVLPPAVEQARQRERQRAAPWRRLRRSLNKRTGWCADASADGWHAQQIVKLGAVLHFDAEVLISLDSDVVVCGAMPERQFVRNGQVALVSARSEQPWMPHWNAAAERLLKLPPAADGVHNYVHHPFVFDAATLRALHAWLEAEYGQPWWQTLLGQRAGQLSEFTVYGMFARHRRALQGLFETTAAGGARWVYTGEDRSQTAHIIEQCFADPATQYLVLQASRHHPVEPYAPLIRQLLASGSGQQLAQ